jgi:c-di-GMP-binding flagellar brake protein YcgR
MADIEKIQKGALLQLFTELQRDKVPLKMILPDGDDVQIPYITDICRRKSAHHFLVSSLQGYRKLSEEAGESRLRFELNDIENIKYVFESDSWELSREMIWVQLPDFVHRYQRRNLFRLEAPHGTRLYFKINDARFKLLVVNISLGGTLGVMVSLTKQMEQELEPYNSKILKNVELLFPAKDHKKAGSIITIKRCQIKRQERNPVTGKMEYAIEFKQISATDQRNFNDLFYKWQRDFLRKRTIMRT